MTAALETPRLLLREWQEKDTADLLAFASSESVKNAGCQPLRSAEEARNAIRCWKTVPDYWAVVLRESGRVIGWITLEDIGRDALYREMEFVIADDCAGRGYATEAAMAVLAYAFESRGLLAAAICHYPENIASRRVIEKCGFTYEGTLRRYSRGYRDSVRYSMLKEEWERRTEKR